MPQNNDKTEDGTIMLYMYRDASNYKAWALARFPGQYSPDSVKCFLSLLDEEGCFNVEATPYLQHPGVVMSATASDDHPLVEVTPDGIWSSQNPPADACDWADIDFVVDISFTKFVDEYRRATTTRKPTPARSWVNW